MRVDFSTGQDLTRAPKSNASQPVAPEGDVGTPDRARESQFPVGDHDSGVSKP